MVGAGDRLLLRVWLRRASHALQAAEPRTEHLVSTAWRIALRRGAPVKPEFDLDWTRAVELMWLGYVLGLIGFSILGGFVR